MDYTTKSCREFVTVLASNEPAPGGGGASALVAAIGTALGNMVGSLTVGKKKYAEVEDEIKAMLFEAEALQNELLALVTRDAEVFAPLAAAYGLPRETDEEKAEKARVMAIVLKDAAAVPLEIMKTCAKAIDLAQSFAEKGSTLAVSDAGCSAAVLKGALEAASLNVLINTKSMEDRDYAEALNAEVEELLSVYGKKAEAVFLDVKGKF